jgi:hypothetical protein
VGMGLSRTWGGRYGVGGMQIGRLGLSRASRSGYVGVKRENEHDVTKCDTFGKRASCVPRIAYIICKIVEMLLFDFDDTNIQLKIKINQFKSQ